MEPEADRRASDEAPGTLSRRGVLRVASGAAVGVAGVAGTANAGRTDVLRRVRRWLAASSSRLPVVDLRSPAPYTVGDFPDGEPEFLVDYLDRYPDTTIKTVDHSLGTRVVLEALATLGGDAVLDNVSTIGGAVNPNTVCSGTRYGDGIEASATEVYNYHSENDDVVCETYARAQGGSGIGCSGSACSSTPNNYADVDVTTSVNAHCNYGKPDVGCVPEIVANF